MHFSWYFAFYMCWFCRSFLMNVEDLFGVYIGFSFDLHNCIWLVIIDIKRNFLQWPAEPACVFFGLHSSAILKMICFCFKIWDCYLCALGSATTGPIRKECADLWPRIASAANAIVWEFSSYQTILNLVGIQIIF